MAISLSGPEEKPMDHIDIRYVRKLKEDQIKSNFFNTVKGDFAVCSESVNERCQHFSKLKLWHSTDGSKMFPRVDYEFSAKDLDRHR